MDELREEMSRRGFRQVHAGPLRLLSADSRLLFQLHGADFNEGDSAVVFMGPLQVNPDRFLSEIRMPVNGFIQRESQASRTLVFDGLYSLQDFLGFERASGLVLVLRRS